MAYEVIGGEKNFWIYSKTDGFDLTHPPTPTSPSIYPRISLETTKARVAIDPAKTALVVIDLQNYFLSPFLGRPKDGHAMKSVDQLLKNAIPACRKAGIPIIWLNWGLTEEEIDGMPPAVVKGFAADTNFVGPTPITGVLGADLGQVTLEDGSIVLAGKALMRNQWNSASYTSLAKTREPQDMLIPKNRLSGFWGRTGIEHVLQDRGIRTLLFAGANTDQCVASSLTDALHKGWDCLLLSDGCSTWSPEFARRCIEFNTEMGWGFVLTCKDFANGVHKAFPN